MGATETLARYGATATAEDIPEEILHEGKRCFINFLAVALYASRDPSLDILLKVFQRDVEWEEVFKWYGKYLAAGTTAAREAVGVGDN